MTIKKGKEIPSAVLEPRYTFDWQCQPKAESLILNILDQCVIANPFIERLHQDLLKLTSTRLFDWLDHVIVGYSDEIQKELEDSGFIADRATSYYRVFHHPGAQLPAVVLKDDALSSTGIAIAVDSIADFLMVRAISGKIEGQPFSGFRRCCISTDNETSFWVVERRGAKTFEPTYYGSEYLKKYTEAVEKWQTRPRDLEDEDEAMLRTLKIAEELVLFIGQDMAAWVVLDCERKYWQARNTAGQLQKNRQDRLGLGWANHDHHTFRSSRRYFSLLVRLFEILGFHCRERFYAGKEAGWGAQVMEHGHSRLVLFLDVDLSPEEVELDFAHQSLPELSALGTVGLWCELHGDSILKGGMHHLEAQFMFDELKDDLAKQGVGMMEPFSNFSYLKQAFTAGEVWHVQAKRLEKILKKGWITHDQADKFLKHGAIGSHMENLQRREGYKGFNQKNVSFIIRKTDPRTIETSEGA